MKTLIYPIRDSSWEYSFDDDTGASSSDDPETESASVVEQVDHLQLTPLAANLQKHATYHLNPTHILSFAKNFNMAEHSKVGLEYTRDARFLHLRPSQQRSRCAAETCVR